MSNLLVVPLVLSAAFGGAFVVNEWSHGAMSEALGMGHHHVLDAGGLHCAAHDDPEQGPMHVSHMHADATMPHDGCPGGSPMHGSGAMPSGGMAGGLGAGAPMAKGRGPHG